MSAAGRSRRSWGWHPLGDDWARRIVADAGVRPGEFVLDVGAGDGALTRHLVDAGARVLAVELNPGRARRLRERFADVPVTVLQADAREVRLPGRPFRVVASPPYGISSDLLRLLLASRSGLVAADLVLQRAFVRRQVEQWASARRFVVRAGRPLPRRAFTPPPQVDSSVLIVRRRRG